MSNSSPFHQGELTIQARANVSTKALRTGRAINDSIPGGALQFVEQQTMLIIGSMDTEGQVWASIIFGDAGFLRATNAQSLELNLTLAGALTEDPTWKNLQTNTNIGILVIDLGSRRRLRINGRISKVSSQQYSIAVTQAYPNCPKYIQRRHMKILQPRISQTTAPVKNGNLLLTTHKKLITSADTFFVASAHPEHGIDASHRGGQPGFVQVVDNQHLRIPDYAGNNMFNTLGNFHSYPYAGLVFIDFEGNRLLQLTGTVEILWSSLDNPVTETGDTQRFWQFKTIAWQESEIPLDIDWEFLDYSPFNPHAQSSQADTNETLKSRL